jgi:hypothetical protein
MTTNGKTNTYRMTARIVGAMYLAGFVVGIGGIVLIQSILGAPDHLATLPANSMLLAIGAVLWLMAVAWDAAHEAECWGSFQEFSVGHRTRSAIFVPPLPGTLPRARRFRRPRSRSAPAQRAAAVLGPAYSASRSCHLRQVSGAQPRRP